MPFSGTFDDFIKPFIANIKLLECGQIMNIQGQDYLIIANLGVVTADLPQENNLARIKHYDANK
ncbi:13244_t:CDS:1, partial [Cetraspora pellucida]